MQIVMESVDVRSVAAITQLAWAPPQVVYPDNQFTHESDVYLVLDPWQTAWLARHLAGRCVR